MLQNYYKIVNFCNNWVLEVSRQARYLGRAGQAYTRMGNLRAAALIYAHGRAASWAYTRAKRAAKC